MNDFKKLAIPKKERLEVQLTDGTEEHNILYIITSLATIKGAEIFKNFRLYSVGSAGELNLLEKRDGDPYFDKLKRRLYRPYSRCGGNDFRTACARYPHWLHHRLYPLYDGCCAACRHSQRLCGR